jgi:hypothetical protein
MGRHVILLCTILAIVVFIKISERDNETDCTFLNVLESSTDLGFFNCNGKITLRYIKKDSNRLLNYIIGKI